jgi:hypothetical protein
MKEFTKQALESANAKLDIIFGIVGPDADMALAILSYALMRLAHDNNIMFASVIKNLAVLDILKYGADDEE